MTPCLANTPVLETERLTLRAPRIEDYPVWEAFYLSERSRHIGAWPDPTVGRAWRAFAHVAGMWALRGFGLFVMCEKGAEDRPLGQVGPWVPQDWPENEIGWSVWLPEAEGKGFAAEAARVTRGFAYQVLGWKTAVSYIDHDNARSIALAERLGATPDPDATTIPGYEGKVRVYRHPAPLALA